MDYQKVPNPQALLIKAKLERYFLVAVFLYLTIFWIMNAFTGIEYKDGQIKFTISVFKIKKEKVAKQDEPDY